MIPYILFVLVVSLWGWWPISGSGCIPSSYAQ